MGRTFFNKKFSDYLGEQRAIDDIVLIFTADIGPTPTPSITPSNTPTPSITPTVTMTPTGTALVTPTPTTTQTPTTSSAPTTTLPQSEPTKTEYADC